ncbi:MAG: MBL fold metallo-hydrolase [Deinococcota bacterium]
MFPLPAGPGEGENLLHLSFLLDERTGVTLIDTGLPHQEERIIAALKTAGLALTDLRRIILTHADIDHVGSAAALVRASGAAVLAHELEAPYIEGALPDPTLRRTPAAILDRMPPKQRAFLTCGFEKVRVDRRLHGGERLDLAGGLRVIHTPGHAPGHISLYLEQDRALIAADALHRYAGRLRPFALMPESMPEAAASVAKLAELGPEVLVPYHGGVVADRALGCLRRVAEEHNLR